MPFIDPTIEERKKLEDSFKMMFKNTGAWHKSKSGKMGLFV